MIDYKVTETIQRVQAEFLGIYFDLFISNSKKLTNASVRECCVDKIAAIKFFKSENVLDVYQESEVNSGNLLKIGEINLSKLKDSRVTEIHSVLVNGHTEEKTVIEQIVTILEGKQS